MNPQKSTPNSKLNIKPHLKLPKTQQSNKKIPVPTTNKQASPDSVLNPIKNAI